jgi:hypothetical protein
VLAALLGAVAFVVSVRYWNGALLATPVTTLANAAILESLPAAP